MFVFGLRISDVVSIGHALEPARDLLRAGRAVDNANGWGLGYYDNGEILLHRRPRDETDTVDFYPLARGLRSHALVGHRRDVTSGRVHKESTHPFRHRNWLFAHCGTLVGFGDYRARLDEELPAHLGRLHPEAPDSTRLFHLFLSRLNEKVPRFDAPDLRLSLAVEALREAVGRLDELAGTVGATDSGSMQVVVSNGRQMLALSRRAPMVSMVYAAPPSPPGNSALRAVLFITAPELPKNTSEARWQWLDDSTIVAVDHDFTLSFHPLAPREP